MSLVKGYFPGKNSKPELRIFFKETMTYKHLPQGHFPGKRAEDGYGRA